MDKHYEYCSTSCHVKVKMPTENEKWLKFHDVQYQFKVQFMMYADFESILKPVDEVYKGKINIMKAERKGKALYKFAYGDVPDPLKVYRGKDYVEVCRAYRGGSKEAIFDIFTTVHDRTY